MIGSLFLWKYSLDDPIFLTDNFFLLKNLFAVTWEPRGKASILSRTETMNTRKRFFALSPAEVSEEDPGCTEVIWKELFERRREAEEMFWDVLLLLNTWPEIGYESKELENMISYNVLNATYKFLLLMPFILSWTNLFFWSVFMNTKEPHLKMRLS